MKLPDNQTLIDAFVVAEATPLPQLIHESVKAHSSLFPEDFLFGSSPYEKYRKWVERILIPRIREMGEEGERIWRAIIDIDLQAHPELLEEAIVVLSAWFFPEHQNVTAVLALLVIVRKVIQAKKDEDK